ncbi:unnamed protein product [Phytophthora lilii]|uniref:Unnamed protein product n=1 Tax=Phytophthora lilii TaxID=2077276 RepID=A0A9W6WZA7_9STRA|nr:unnamed protein product [Phytophthora lilii]
MDYYEFTVSVRRGVMTSRDMHWMLSCSLDLKVQGLQHTDSKDTGINDEEWRVTIQGGACPPHLQKVSYILIDDVEVMVHHHTVNVKWPCRTCHSPEHPNQGNRPSILGDGVLPTTIEQLKLLLMSSKLPEQGYVEKKDPQEGRIESNNLRRRDIMHRQADPLGNANDNCMDHTAPPAYTTNTHMGREETVALETLSWKQVYTMEGATPYQTQTIAKLKLRRLRLWTGPENRFMCSNAGCRTEACQGRGHMVWTCPEAQKLWKQQVILWDGLHRTGTTEGKEESVIDGWMKFIFGFKLITIPQWLSEWGAQQDVETWDHLFNTAAELWALSCAVTLTVIWRLNVDRVHNNGSKQSIFDWRSQVRDAISRYMSNLYPLMATTKYPIGITAALLNRTFDEQISPMDTDSSDTDIYNFTFSMEEPRTRGWTHHYRTYNKMADGGANYATDKKQSAMVDWALQPNPHPLQAVILAAIDGDITYWKERREANERLQSI